MKTAALIFVTSMFLTCCINSQDKVTNKKEEKSGVVSNKESKKDIVLPEVFETYEQEEQFRVLVGADFNDFVTDFNTISEDEDLDAIGAKVFSGMVPGLGTINECIVMITDHGFIAAIIKGDTILYFCSYDNYKTTTPKTIEAWINQKGHKTVKIMQ